MTSFRIVEPVFKTEPVFILGCSAEEAELFLRKRYRIRARVPRCQGTMLTFDRFPWRVVWSKLAPNTPAATAELLHEIFHLVTRICGDKGVPIIHHIPSGECGDEAAAYLFEFFAGECLRRCWRRKGKK